MNYLLICCKLVIFAKERKKDGKTTRYMDGKTILLLLLSMVPGLFLYAEPLNWKETFNGVADSSLPETEEPADTLFS